MTELHNMSVPPRSKLTLQREVLPGRRYRVAIEAPVNADAEWPIPASLTRYFRKDGAACALALLHPPALRPVNWFRDQIAMFRHDADALATLRQLCDAELDRVGLPDGFGFFVDETPGPVLNTLPTPAAIAVLAARSGPLYLPGRFEPSLITAGAVTLFFPSVEGDGGVRCTI
jgi:hypothetical protein